ncbi:ABC transporter transmembrane domain-containing protein [Ureibacillus manganicus]|uniref:Multidrug ABC transporter ATP-binding protein n=1 Tax=Ureibacillus manganicus DSM 26584 TaxID=1384049 RepID=A0A0A3ISI7_9BACL|nr:ABC transporter transmembrane domain-containing protein [Ureibacillus manganicus]KGR77767.1 multidrug ABC transporter ATP-binding protein [Ureibacillus manganicus DSM 26584]
MNVFFKLGWFFKERKKQYIVGLLALMLVAILQLIPPKVIGYTIDEIGLGTLTTNSLLMWVGIILLSSLLIYGLRYFWRLMIFGSSNYMAMTLRKKLFLHFSKMSPSFYQQRRIGDLMAHATNDVSAVQQTAGGGVLTLFDSITTGTFVILAMAITIDWRLTLIALIPMPLVAISSTYYGKLLHERFHIAQSAFSDLNDKTQESITGIKVIKTFGQQNEDIDDFKRLSSEVVSKNMKVARVDSLFDPTISLIIGISFFLSLGFGAKFIVEGSMTIGDLVAFNTYLGLLVWPMLAFGMLFNIMERGSASYDRIESILSIPVEIEDKPNAINERPDGNLIFNVNKFTFPGDERPSLKNVNFELNRGETLGIVGKTGSGKTAILKLLLREFEGYEGEIIFGGRRIDDYRKMRLLESIGYVPQDHFLFSSSVYNNIAFTNPDADVNQVEYAARLAHIHEDILRFTDGYKTVVGERGVSLSGGQKQRISIARALLSNPELLILDDSLSAVDAKTEEAILEALKEERSDKTTIITSHRLSAIQHAHIIIVMHEGSIVEKGTHEELMELKGRYFEMYNLQQLEQLVEKGGEVK